MEKLKLLIVDDHKLFREGLKLLLASLDEVGEIWEASDGEVFLQMIKTCHPDLVLMDIEMPRVNGIEATTRALEQYPELKIMALSMFGDEEYFQKMIDAGVCGFLLKNSDFSEVKKAITNAVQGNNYFTEEILYKLVNRFKSRTPVPEPSLSLSDREQEVLLLICKGLVKPGNCRAVVHQQTHRGPSPGQPANQDQYPQCRQPGDLCDKE